MGRFLLPLLVSFFLLFASVFAQQGYPVPPSEGKEGGVKIGPGILIPLIIIPGLIKKALERGELPTYPPIKKQALNVSQSGNTYTVDWVIYYANNTNTTQNGVTITEGPINTIVSGSLQQPTGWTGSLVAGNTIAQWTGNAPPINGYMSATVTTSMATSFNVTGGGDGFRAIPYRHVFSGNKLRIYFINHHEPMGSSTTTGTIFKCVDTTTGSYCPGFPKKLPKGDSSGKHSASGMYDEEYYIDPFGKLYYAVTSMQDKEFGLGCYNLETDTECGFYKLGTNPYTSSPQSSWAYVKGPWKVGNELYMVGGDYKLYCLNATNPSLPCFGLGGYFTGFVFPSISFKDPASVGNSIMPQMSVGPGVFGEVVGNKLYFITDSDANNNSKHIRAFCFDTVSKASCPGTGWGILATHSGSASYPRVWGSFIYYDASMNPKYICTRLDGPKQYCFSLLNGSYTSGVPSSVFPSVGLGTGLGPEVTIGTKSYFPDFMYNASSSNPGRVLCWDWSTGSPCAPTWEYKSWTHPTKGNPRDYSVNVDDKGCIWVLGDNAPAMWYFDPSKPTDNKGIAQKCENREGKQELVFQPWKYCSGPKPFLWLKLEVANASLSDFTKLEVKVKDSSNNVIFTHDFVAGGSLTVNLPSNVQSQINGQPLNLEVNYALSSNSQIKNFEVRAYYHASPLEFCFKSTHNCNQGPIKNKVSASTVENPFSITLPKPSGCPDVADDPYNPEGGTGSDEQVGSGGNGGGGGTSGEGTGGGPTGSTGGSAGGQGQSGGISPWWGVGLTPSPIPSPAPSGTPTSPIGPSPSVGGAQVIEKDGTVQLVPETKKRCYYRPKQKELAQAEVKPVKPKVVKKPVPKQPVAIKPQTNTAPKPKRRVVKVSKPAKPIEMEYVCEPEK